MPKFDMHNQCAYIMRIDVEDDMFFDAQAPKRAANLSVNSDLLRQARELDINLSAAFEEALSKLVIARQQQAWLEQNKHAIDMYNQKVEMDGVFGDALRAF